MLRRETDRDFVTELPEVEIENKKNIHNVTFWRFHELFEQLLLEDDG